LRKDVPHLQEHARDADDPTKLTGAHVIALRLVELESDASIKESTRHYGKQIFAALVRSWPEFPTLEIRRIIAEQCQDWTRKKKTACPSRKLRPTWWNSSRTRT
jgi:hypothetical protein